MLFTGVTEQKWLAMDNDPLQRSKAAIQAINKRLQRSTQVNSPPILANPTPPPPAQKSLLRP